MKMVVSDGGKYGMLEVKVRNVKSDYLICTNRDGVVTR